MRSQPALLAVVVCAICLYLFGMSLPAVAQDITSAPGWPHAINR